MGMDFSSTNYLHNTSSLITAEPFTMFCWVNTPATAAFREVMTVQEDNPSAWYDNGSYLGIKANDLVRALRGQNSGTAHVAEGGALIDDTWTPISLTATTGETTSKVGTNSQNSDTTPASVATTCTRMQIGAAYWVSALREPWNAEIAEAAFWDAELTLSEIESLHAGYSPLFIRPQNLISYLPMVTNTIDVMGNTWTLEGPALTVTTHPPVIYPTAQIIQFPTPAAGGGPVITAGTLSLMGVGI